MSAASDSAEAFATQFELLQRGYLAQLPAKIEQMQVLLQTLLTQGWDAEQGETLYRMVHSLAGSGGSMGFKTVSDSARALEQEIKRIVQGKASVDALRERLLAGLEQLSTAVSAAGMSAARVLADEASPSTLPPLKILVVDDDPGGQALLSSFLRADEHTVFTASDGEQAVARFLEHRPDMVLMDVVMPRMNGYEAAKQIKAACGKQFVPLLFLTALQGDKDLVACIEAGGDDFIVKPYNRVLLRAKLSAMHRISQLHRELERYQQKTQEEIELSRHVFEAATDRNVATSAVAHWHSAVGHFSGDLLLYAHTPRGRLFVLLGDFTGHGLAAALGALPVADLFYGMVEDETTLPDLAIGLNRKLRSVLPVGHFCAASLIALDIDAQAADIWNGGVPGVWVFNATGRVVSSIASSKLPLGVVGDELFDAKIERIGFLPGERVLLFSDGLSEATNAAGEMFGDERITQLLVKAGGNDPIAVLRRGIEMHLAGSEAHDDISMALIDPARATRLT